MIATAGLRRRLVAATGAAAALAAALLVVTTHVVLDRAGDATVERVLTERAEAVLDTVDVASGDDDDALPAVGPGDVLYDATGARLAGRPPREPGLARRFEELSRVTATRFEAVGEDYRILARPFEAGGRRGVLVVAASLGPYESDERVAFLISLGSGALLVLVAVAVAGWISRRALAPVQQMAATAREWSEHDLERRFDLGAPTDEIRSLGQVLDELLERVAAAIRAEQRLSAEMAHELRSPLTTIRATADLIALRDDLDPQLREDVEDVLAACTAMSTTITTLLELARDSRAGGRGGCTGAQVASAVTDLGGSAAGGRLDVDVDARLRIAAPIDVVVRALGPLVDNARRHADVVRVRGVLAGTRVHLRVEDDGPGVDDAVVADLFAPGAAASPPGAPEGSGAGLGLALARRVARACGGEVTLERARGGELGGAVLLLDLPLAAEADLAGA